jgi:hypothetical protein
MVTYGVGCHQNQDQRVSLGLQRARSLAVLALPGLFDAQPLLAAFDSGFANLPDDRDAVAAPIWPDMRVIKCGFCREHLVVGQLL